MHEFSLADDLLKTARLEARKAGMTRLDKIRLKIGEISGVSIDSLEFAFGFLREEDELTKNTELVIERVKGRGRCGTCGKVVDLDRLFLFCPDCETATVEILEGREFMLVSLEGEDASDESGEGVGNKNEAQDGAKPGGCM